MSKAILVLDEMPEKCEDCQFAYVEIDDTCLATGKNIDEYMSNRLWPKLLQRPKWCPLIEMPEKIHAGDNHEYYDSQEDYGLRVAYCDGWNDCLNEISGGEGDE